MSQGISAHGTRLYIKPSIADPGGGTLWTAGQLIEITEIGDITMPGFSRNDHDITSHNRDVDTYVLGVERRDPMAFPLFFNKAILSHKVLRAMQGNKDPLTNMANEFRVSSPDGETMLLSGGVKEMKETAPVDGAKTVNVSIRFTGEFYLNDVLYN